MTKFSTPSAPYFLTNPSFTFHHQVPVKTEAEASPDLSPAPAAEPSQQGYQFKFHPSTLSSHAPLPPSRNPSEPPPCLPPSLFRFGLSGSPYSLPSAQLWPPTSSSQHRLLQTHQTHNDDLISNTSSQSVDYIQPAMSYSDEYDNVSDLADVSLEHSGLGAYAGSAQERTIRRRSSKGASRITTLANLLH
jgi:hypothetical protein